MNRLFSLTVLFCLLCGPVFASTPDDVLKLLSLGNQKFVLEKSVAASPLAAIVIEPALTVSPATLFGLPENRVTTLKAGASGLDKALGVPVIIVLGSKESIVWDTYATALKGSPELIHAVMKGETSVLGATFDAASGEVKILGAHPDLLIMAAQYVLGLPVIGSSEPATAAVPADKASAAPATAEAKKPEAPAAPAAAQKPAKTEVQAPVPASEGGSGPLVIVLFIVALIGTVVFLDKTVLKS